MPKTKKITEETTTQTNNSPAKSSITSMDQLMSKMSMRPPKKGQDIKAKIVTLGKRQIIFDIGWKSYAVLGELETRELSTYLPYLKEGDDINATVVVEESKEGYPVLSMRKFFEKGKWDILEAKQKDEEIIEVVCGEYGKGGIFIDFMGIRGVIPKIQLTEDFIAEPDKLYGQKIKVKVLEVDKAKNRLVVSQKAVALGISYKDLKNDFDAIKVGEIYKAKVIGFSDFGVFCEVNKIEGLIHISEISWAKVSDPTRDIKVDQELDVMVVEKNETNYKLNLSIKRLTPDPWTQIADKYPQDKEVEGEIIRKERYGYIVRLEPGIEGLIHISKVSATDDLTIGKKVTVYVEKVDLDNRRMSLIIQAQAKPVVYR